ncbi:MAG: hypothetical protein WC341_16900 [Bacteroidales bacterium]|jgi:hypothetical protein
MKNFIKITLLVMVSFFFSSSCKKACDGRGTIEVTNKSLSTVQRIVIDGVNYGTIDPGEKFSHKMLPGKYTVIVEGISGGEGCGDAELTVAECETTGISCSGK